MKLYNEKKTAQHLCVLKAETKLLDPYPQGMMNSKLLMPNE